jgi:hypothetical protein
VGWGEGGLGFSPMAGGLGFSPMAGGQACPSSKAPTYPLLLFKEATHSLRGNITTMSYLLTTSPALRLPLSGGSLVQRFSTFACRKVARLSPRTWAEVTCIGPPTNYHRGNMHRTPTNYHNHVVVKKLGRSVGTSRNLARLMPQNLF